MSSKSAREALPAAYSLMSTTMTPFLYQTKTLSNFTWAGANAIYRARYAQPISSHRLRSLTLRHLCNRQYSTSPGWGREESNRERDGNHYASSGPMKIKPPPSPRRSRDVNYEIPFEFDEKSRFANRTEDIPAISRRETVQVNEFGEVEDGEAEDAQGIDFEGGEGDILEAGGGNSSTRPRESTITETEKRAFQKIFSDIFENQSSPSASAQKPFVNEDMARSKLEAIMGKAVDQLQSYEEKQRILESYPPALRTAAAKALGLTRSRREDPFDGEMEELAELKHDELEALRDPERERVENLMKSANTDVELWEILEKEVFSLIPKLGLKDIKSDSKSETETAKKPTKAKLKKAKKLAAQKPKDNEERFENIVAQSPNGTDVSALTLYGPLYPSYLLLGLRLLDRSFAKPSPLSLSILPKIKSLGPISHVLGASTQLYNELLRIYYYRYEDFKKISGTLNEMEKSAVEIDEETLEIIIEILKMKAIVARGDKGKVMKALWTMPQYAKVNFQYWRNKFVDILEKNHENSQYPSHMAR